MVEVVVVIVVVVVEVMLLVVAVVIIVVSLFPSGIHDINDKHKHATSRSIIVYTV